MAGRISGTAARIKKINKKAVYVHCGSHVLNLCVATCCQDQLVRNMMNTVRVVSEFYNFSPKRASQLKKSKAELIPKVSHDTLFNVCATRWVARLDGLANFIELYPAVVDSLEVIKDNEGHTWNADSTQKANSLYYSIVAFPFLVSLVVVSRCLEITRPLTNQLQSVQYDAGLAREKVSLLKVMLDQMRVDVQKRHDSWFSEAVTLADSVGTVPNKPRTTGRQTNRSNVPAESASQYYCRSLTIPFLDHLCNQLQTRFSETSLDVLDALYGMPKSVVTNKDWKSKFSKFLEIYKDDLPNPFFLNTELFIWYTHCKTTASLPTTMKEVLLFANYNDFPNINTAFRIFATIPVTTCTCERSISCLRRLKTRLRSGMTASRLRALSMLNVHRDIDLDIDEIIDKFAAKHPRRLALAHILSD